MSRFRLRQRTASGLLTRPIDTRFGTARSSIGVVTFGLNTGRRRVWVNSQRADNTGDGLSPGAAKKGWKEAFQTLQGSGFATGDHLMIAGKSGMPTYTDDALDGGAGMANVASTTGSMTYPTVIQSYDPDDPLNETKYGNLVGAAMPILQATASGVSLNINVGSGNGYVAIKGLELKGQSSLQAYASDGLSFAGGAGTHPGIFVQNCRFNRFGFNGNQLRDAHISFCSLWNGFGIYCDGDYRDFWMSDLTCAHNGWTIGASRDDTQAAGGATQFQHTFYLHSGGLRINQHRIVSIDGCNEGVGSRSPVTGSEWISFDAAQHFLMGGFSAGVYDPGGVFTLDDALAIGGSEINASFPFFSTLSTDNCFAGSYARNVGAFDNPKRLVDNANLISYNRAFPADESAEVMTLDKWSCWNAHTRLGYVEQSGANLTLNTNNSILDVSPLAYNGSSYTHSETGTSVRSSAPSGYLAQTAWIAAMGFASRNAMVNLMLYRPDLQWAPALCGNGLSMMGLTPQYATMAIPDFSGITPPTVY